MVVVSAVGAGRDDGDVVLTGGRSHPRRRLAPISVEIGHGIGEHNTQNHPEQEQPSVHARHSACN